MDFNLKSYEKTLITCKADYQTYCKQVEERKELLHEKKRRAINLEEARLIIQTVGQKTQQELEFQISEIVSMALAAVFDDPYKFKIEFVLRRGKTEADLYFMKDGNRYFPLDDNGGGAVDVASFALRIALWGLKKNRNVIFFDEPFKFLSKKYQIRAGEMIKLISKKLNLQIIFITHINELIEASDKVFRISKKQSTSMVDIQ